MSQNRPSMNPDELVAEHTRALQQGQIGFHSDMLVTLARALLRDALTDIEQMLNSDTSDRVFPPEEVLAILVNSLRLFPNGWEPLMNPLQGEASHISTFNGPEKTDSIYFYLVTYIDEETHILQLKLLIHVEGYKPPER